MTDFDPLPENQTEYDEEELQRRIDEAIVAGEAEVILVFNFPDGDELEIDTSRERAEAFVRDYPDIAAIWAEIWED